MILLSWSWQSPVNCSPLRASLFLIMALGKTSPLFIFFQIKLLPSGKSQGALHSYNPVFPLGGTCSLHLSWRRGEEPSSPRVTSLLCEQSILSKRGAPALLNSPLLACSLHPMSEPGDDQRQCSWPTISGVDLPPVGAGWCKALQFSGSRLSGIKLQHRAGREG